MIQGLQSSSLMLPTIDACWCQSQTWCQLSDIMRVRFNPKHDSEVLNSKKGGVAMDRASANGGAINAAIEGKICSTWDWLINWLSNAKWVWVSNDSIWLAEIYLTFLSKSSTIDWRKHNSYSPRSGSNNGKDIAFACSIGS